MPKAKKNNETWPVASLPAEQIEAVKQIADKAGGISWAAVLRQAIHQFNDDQPDNAAELISADYGKCLPFVNPYTQPGQKELFDKIAEQHQVGRSQVVRAAVQAYLNKQEANHG